MIQLLSLSLAVYQFCSIEVRLRCICIRSYFPGKGFLHTLKHRIKCFWPMQQWAKHTCIYSNHKENSNNKPGINVALKNFHFLFVHVFTGGIVGGGLQNLGLCSADTSFEKGGIFIVPTCCDTWPWFLRSLPLYPYLVAVYYEHGVLGTYYVSRPTRNVLETRLLI